MAVNLKFRCFCLLTVFIVRPLISMGNNTAPKQYLLFSHKIIIRSLGDSVPVNNKNTEEITNKDQAVIKGVPKSHKQIKPIAMPAVTSIKPLQLIKPKIITPVIRIH